MAINREHIRAISKNAFFYFGYAASPYADPVVGSGGGGVVPVNKIRTIYFMKITHNQTTKQLVQLWSNGVTGTIVLDKIQVPGSGAGAVIGRSSVKMGTDLEEPVYTLTEGQQIGVTIGAGTCYVFYTYYDEEG